MLGLGLGSVLELGFRVSVRVGVRVRISVRVRVTGEKKRILVNDQR